MMMSLSFLLYLSLLSSTIITLCYGDVNRIDFDHSVDTAYDVIVVGAGTSGCVLAQTLGEGGLSVLLIERGHGNIDLKPEERLATSLVAAPTAMIDETLSEVVFTNKGVPYITGRTMGGMSTINLAAYTEETSEYFDMLQEDYGVEFDEVEWQRATEYIRNAGILSPAPTVRKSWFENWVLSEKQVAENKAVSGSLDTHAPLSYSVRPEQMTRTFSLLNPITSERMSSCSLLTSPNVDLLERATVLSVVFEELGPAHNARATCVAMVHNTEKDTENEVRACVRTGGKILLAAGVVNTPAILLRSGVGDSQHLAELGVKSVVHNSDVGRGFQDRAISASNMWPVDEDEVESEEVGEEEAPRFPTSKSFNSHIGLRKLKCAEDHCPKIVFGELTGGTTFAVFAGLLAEKRSKDPSTSPLFKSILRSQSVQLFQRVRARLTKDVTKFLDFITFARPSLSGDDDEPSAGLDKFTNLVSCSKDSAAITVGLAEPKSRGFVELDSNLNPVIGDLYFSDTQDMTDMIKAVSRLSEYTSAPRLLELLHERGDSCLNLIEPVMTKAMLSAAQRATLYGSAEGSHPLSSKDVFPPQVLDTSVENMKMLIDVFFLPGWHGTSTAAMGKVVGTDFAVKGVDQLSIIDASVLPQITRVDPLATVLALGRYGGKKILEDIERSEKREFE